MKLITMALLIGLFPLQALATGDGCEPIDTPPPVTPPILVVTPNDADPSTDHTQQHWTGICKRLETGQITAHTAFSPRFWFDPVGARRLAHAECKTKILLEESK